MITNIEDDNYEMGSIVMKLGSQWYISEVIIRKQYKSQSLAVETPYMKIKANICTIAVISSLAIFH